MTVGPANSRSRDINFATVTGHLSADPEFRYTGTGQPLCIIRFMNEVTVGPRTYTETYFAHAFGHLGLRAYEQLSTGDRIIMFGRWHERAYEKNGKWHRSHNFICDEIAVSVVNRMADWFQQREQLDRSRTDLLDAANKPAYDATPGPFDIDDRSM